jgi:sugar lactone lactonase YvrE/uncharacterized coiled-coil protein SlyX
LQGGLGTRIALLALGNWIRFHSQIGMLLERQKKENPMKRICTALFASLMMVSFSVPAWANGAPKSKLQCQAKKTEKHHHHHKIDRHKLKVLTQFGKLKKEYRDSLKDAQKMFLEYLGSGVPCSDTDVDAIRAEYEQQITQLNETIATHGQQITGLNTTIATQEQQITGLNTTIATQEQQITGLNATIATQGQQITGLNATIATQGQQITGLNTTIAAQQQQITDLNAAAATHQQQLADMNATIDSQQQQLAAQAALHQQEIANLTATMTQECSDQVDTAYNNGLAAGMETCATTTPAGDPQPTGSLSTGTHYPYALDVDGSGNTYIVERNYLTVVGYDNTGSQIAEWTSNTLSMPVDLAVDSQGNIYILDQGAEEYLQKYTPGGQRIGFVADPVQVIYPLGLFIDSQDNVYITDMGGEYGGRILKFNSSGALTSTFGEVSDFELFGDEYSDIAVDEAGQNIYIVTRYNQMVAKFSMDGTYQGAWQGDLRSPNSIAVGAQGQVFVADTYNSQVDQYDAEGNLIYTITDQLYRPSRIVVDNAGKLFIAVERDHVVQVYQ